MRRLFPAFLQRRWLVAAARRALQSGRPGAALEILRDELLAQDPRAEALRALVLPLVPAPPPAPPPREAHARGQLGELLAEMRAKREQGARAATVDANASAAGAQPRVEVPGEALALRPGDRASAGSNSADAATRARPLRLRMSLDDAGTFLVCAGTTASVGHSRAGEADVPILADLLPRHARFVLEPASFHGGPAWRVEPLGGARVRFVATVPDAHAGNPAHAPRTALGSGEQQVPGEELGPGGRRLSGGERLRLSEHTELVFAMPDRAGSSAVLELAGSLEAAGARRVLLFAPGAEGRITVGASSARHVPVNLSGVELELEFAPAAPGSPEAPCSPGSPGDGARGARLVVRCASGFFLDASPAGAPLTEHALALPLARAEHLRLLMPSSAARPRWLSFSPLEDA